MITNTRRIQRYLEARLKLEIEQMKLQKERESSQEQRPTSFLVYLTAIFRALTVPKNRGMLELSC